MTKFISAGEIFIFWTEIWTYFSLEEILFGSFNVQVGYKNKVSET